MLGSTPRVFTELIYSLKFYYMLSIVMASQGEPPAVSGRALDEYIKDLKEIKMFSNEVLNWNCIVAYQQLPKEFLRMYNIEVSDTDRTIKIIEDYHKPSGR
jgi:hypothetical protein